MFHRDFKAQTSLTESQLYGISFLKKYVTGKNTFLLYVGKVIFVETGLTSKIRISIIQNFSQEPSRCPL